MVRLIMLLCVLTWSGFANADNAETMEIKVVKLENERENCKIMFQGKNMSSFTFEAFDIKFRIMGKASQLIKSGAFRINAIRPGKTLTDFVYADNAKCKEISEIVVEQVEYCEIDGHFIDGCERYLAFPPSKIKISY